MLTRLLASSDRVGNMTNKFGFIPSDSSSRPSGTRVNRVRFAQLVWGAINFSPTADSCLPTLVVSYISVGGQMLYVSDAGPSVVIVYHVYCDRSFKVHVMADEESRRDIVYIALTTMDVTMYSQQRRSGTAPETVRHLLVVTQHDDVLAIARYR